MNKETVAEPNSTGYVDQHIQYLPFGELFISQRNTSFDSRYKFTAKELDNETNYTYFGARYYDSDLSIWLSVDPLSDKYPSLSPYAYCANNPVILVDPDGRFPIPAAFRAKFPHITKYIENNLEGYFLNSPRILSTLNKYSVGMLTPEQIRKDFRPDSGPTINYKSSDEKGYSGEYDYETNTIYFSENKLLNYEMILKSEKIKLENKQMAMFEFVKTFVNEYVHYGDALDGFDAVMDNKGNIINDYNAPEPTWGHNIFEEGNEASRELYPSNFNGRQLYHYYMYGQIIDRISNKIHDQDNSNIDRTMIPPL